MAPIFFSNGSSRSISATHPFMLAHLIFVVISFALPCMSCADDRSDLLETAHAYFQSEKDGDTHKVWELLAPSSEFKRAYSYVFYEEMVRRNPLVLRDYKIEGIVEIRENQDTTTMPGVEKIALVKVTVILAGEGTGDLTQLRVFTFLKESGRWLKG